MTVRRDAMVSLLEDCSAELTIVMESCDPDDAEREHLKNLLGRITTALAWMRAGGNP